MNDNQGGISEATLDMLNRRPTDTGFLCHGELGKTFFQSNPT